MAETLGDKATGGAMAGVAVADHGITAVLKHLDFLHGFLDKVVNPIAIGPGATARALLEKPHELNPPEKLGNIDTKYDQLARAVEHHSEPGAYQDHLDSEHGHLAEEQEHSSRAQMAVGALNLLLPKQVGEPALMAERFNPLRAAKIKFIRAFNTLNDPLTPLKSLPPDKVKLLDTVHPETMNLLCQTATGYLIRNRGIKLTTVQKRYLTHLMGAPMSRRNDPGYMKRLHETAVEPPPPAPVTASGGLASSAKITQAGIRLDATNTMKLGMGF